MFFIELLSVYNFLFSLEFISKDKERLKECVIYCKNDLGFYLDVAVILGIP